MERMTTITSNTVASPLMTPDELASASHAHADQLAHLLSHQQPAEPRHDLELRSALLEHARQQHDATDELAEHITAVTTLVADLGQTISMLAVAAAKEARTTAAPPAPLTPPTTPRSAPPTDTLKATPPSPSPPDRLTPLQTHSRAPAPPASISILPTIDTFTGDAGITPERRWSG